MASASPESPMVSESASREWNALFEQFEPIDEWPIQQQINETWQIVREHCVELWAFVFEGFGMLVNSDPFAIHMLNTAPNDIAPENAEQAR